MGSLTFQRIYDVVKQIPPGRVATYGDVARMAGMPRRARFVGFALRVLPEGTAVPWHRVVNAAGEISVARLDPAAGAEQRALLEDEGVEFGPDGRVDLQRFRWTPEA